MPAVGHIRALAITGRGGGHHLTSACLCPLGVVRPAVGHVKTVAIMGGGVLVFKDEVGLVKLCGMVLAMCGIIW